MVFWFSALLLIGGIVRLFGVIIEFDQNPPDDLKKCIMQVNHENGRENILIIVNANVHKNSLIKMLHSVANIRKKVFIPNNGSYLNKR